MLVEYAKCELARVGMGPDATDELDIMMRDGIIKLVEVFANENHSGTSAHIAASFINKLINFEPLTPLTGEDDEWTEVSEGRFQNKRCFHVFKENGNAYDSNGIIWYDWRTDDDELTQYKNFYTNFDSKVAITFPYTPKKEYRQRPDKDRHET